MSAIRREQLLVLTISLALPLLLLLPYWLSYESAEPGAVFSGIIMNAEDSQSYFAKMLQGYDGAWRYRIPFTSEPHEPVFLGTLYLALGHAARVLNLSLETVWHAARFMAGVFLFLTVHWFIAAYVPDRRERLPAYLLALFGSGLGWLLFLLNQPYWLDAFPIDFKMPEAHLFFTAFTFPHVALGTALLLISVHLSDRLLQALPEQRTGAEVLVGAASNMLLVVAYPFLLYLLLLTVALLWALRSYRRRSLLLGPALRIGITLIPAAPLVANYALVLQKNPVFAAWNEQAGTPSPPWPHYLVAFGPMLLLSFVGWRAGREDRKRDVLWLWTLAAALLLYAPLGPQRRFVQGLQVPLAILATLGFLRVVWPAVRRSVLLQTLLQRPRYTEKGLRRLFVVFFLAFMALSNVYVFASVGATGAWQQPYPLFRTQAEMEAVRWLRAQTAATDVVLGAYETGSLVAARAGNYVVIGHWAETKAFAEKEAAVARFFEASTRDAWRRQFLTEQRVAYVWHGPQERSLGAFDPGQTSYLQPVAEFDSITLYLLNSP